VSLGKKPPLEGPGFIIVRCLSDAEAVDLLLETFPELLENESRQDLLESGAYTAYERLGDRFRANSKDPIFLERVGAFVNKLEESRDRYLLELLPVTLLENIAQDGMASRLLKSKLSSSSRALLEDVERNFPGRTDTGEIGEG
jgi:hypothetical protein